MSYLWIQNLMENHRLFYDGNGTKITGYIRKKKENTLMAGFQLELFPYRNLSYEKTTDAE